MKKLICSTCRAKLMVPTELMGQPTVCPTCFTEVPVEPSTATETAGDPQPQQKEQVNPLPHDNDADVSKVPYKLQKLGWRGPPTKLLDSAAEMQHGIVKLKIGKPSPNLSEVKASKLVWLGGGFLIVFTFLVLGHQIGLLKSVDKKLIEQAWVGIPLGGIILAVGLLLTRWAGGQKRPIPKLTLWIFAEGLLWQRDHEYAAWTWHEIKTARVVETGISEHDLESKEYEYQLTGIDGEMIRFSTRSEPLCREAAEYVMEQAAAAALPTAKQKVETGEVCSFGKVKIDKNGLTIGGDLYSWGQIKEVEFDHSQFVVLRRDGEQVVVWGKQVENPFLAMELCSWLT